MRDVHFDNSIEHEIIIVVRDDDTSSDDSVDDDFGYSTCSSFLIKTVFKIKLFYFSSLTFPKKQGSKNEKKKTISYLKVVHFHGLNQRFKFGRRSKNDHVILNRYMTHHCLSTQYFICLVQ